ncbi:MAG: mismatch-specific DNA-glycosylase [Chloroflexota bacterium]
MLDRLPPLLAPGLRVVFVGTRPGMESLRTGFYYASPTNAFYATLHQSGFTSRLWSAVDCRALLGVGIGLDDVHDDPAALRRRLEEVAPVAVCFNSKQALAAFAGDVSGDWRGPAAERHVLIADVRTIWAVPDSSGLAGRFRIERVALLRDLRARFGWTPKP